LQEDFVMAYESESELEALPELEDELEEELEDESEGELEDEMEDEAGLEGEGCLGALGNIAGSLVGESEGEYESEDEYEEEISPIRKIYADAMMEHLGELAAESESEDEAAEHFLPLVGMATSKLLPVVAKAVAPIARKALPKIAKAVTGATPHLTHAESGKSLKHFTESRRRGTYFAPCLASPGVQWARSLTGRREEGTYRHAPPCELWQSKLAG
jgi:hypothetical protein